MDTPGMKGPSQPGDNGGSGIDAPPETQVEDVTMKNAEDLVTFESDYQMTFNEQKLYEEIKREFKLIYTWENQENYYRNYQEAYRKYIN